MPEAKASLSPELESAVERFKSRGGSSAETEDQEIPRYHPWDEPGKISYVFPSLEVYFDWARRVAPNLYQQRVLRNRPKTVHGAFRKYVRDHGDFRLSFALQQAEFLYADHFRKNEEEIPKFIRDISRHPQSTEEDRITAFFLLDFLGIPLEAVQSGTAGLETKGETDGEIL